MRLALLVKALHFRSQLSKSGRGNAATFLRSVIDIVVPKFAKDDDESCGWLVVRVTGR